MSFLFRERNLEVSLVKPSCRYSDPFIHVCIVVLKKPLLLCPYLAVWLSYGKACPLPCVFAHLETLYSLERHE
jgi:hypothetical protein